VKDNVDIKYYERGKLVGTRNGHNVWVQNGNQFLSQLIAYASFSPLTTERDDRIRYMGVGIGGKQQGSGLAFTGAMETSYPWGSDPHGTNGQQYSKEYPIDPFIGTLERPVRVSGTENDYTSAEPTDVWLIDTPSFFITRQSSTSVNYHGRVSGLAGDVVYGSFTTVPLSEVGLFTSALAVSKFFAYSPLVAYFSFDTIPMTASTVVEFVWTVRF
jgi:hypothetical protein